jgi:hypothetical protein
MAAATSSETVRGSYIERKNKSGMNFDQKHILRHRKSKKAVTLSTGRSPGPAGPQAQHFGSTLTSTSTFVFASTSNRVFAAEEPGTASSAAIGSRAFGTPHVGHSIPRNPRFAGP